MEASLMLIFGEKTNREPKKNTTTPDTNSNNKKEILMSA
jgi:hypothetical protein